MRQPTPHIVCTRDITEADQTRVCHPLGENSEVLMTQLSERTGLTRLGLSIGRIPPGKESFVPHAHKGDEEFVFIISGTGQVLIGEKRHDVAAGDFVGFPIDGLAHNLHNTGIEDLVYLMGGERNRFDMAHFPTLGKVGVGDPINQTMTFYETESASTRPFSDWTKASDKQ